MQPAPRSAAGFTIRRAGPDDAPAIARVLDESFAAYRGRYTEEAYAATVLSEAEVLSRLAEGPVWVVLPGSGASCVATVSALKTDRGQGLGWQLLRRVEHFAKEAGLARLYLSTTPFLDRAIALYEHYGFRRSTEGPSLLFGTPLFTMVKTLAVDER